MAIELLVLTAGVEPALYGISGRFLYQLEYMSKLHDSQDTILERYHVVRPCSSARCTRSW